MRVRAAVSAFAAAIVLTTTSTFSAGAAEGDSSSMRVLRADSRQLGRVSLLISSSDPKLKPSDIQVTENGKEIKSFTSRERVRNSSLPTSTVVILDASQATLSNEADVFLRSATKRFIASKGDDEAVALIALRGGTASIVQDFSTSESELNTALGSVEPAGNRPLYDGLAKAATILKNRPGSLNIVTMAIGDDSGSKAKLESVSPMISTKGIRVFTWGVAEAKGAGPVSIAPLSTLIGGNYTEVKTADRLYERMDDLRNVFDDQWIVTYKSLANVEKPGEGRSSAMSVVVTANGVKQEISFAGGVVTFGKDLTLGLAEHDEWVKKISFLTGPFGIALASLMLLGAAGLGGFGLMRLLDSRKTSLDSMLRPYSDDPGAPEQDVIFESSHVDSAFMKRALAKTEQIAKEKGFMNWVIDALQKADIQMHPAEAILFAGMGIMLLSAVGLIRSGPIGFLVMLIPSCAMPFLYLAYRAKKRKSAFAAQLPDTLQLLASSLRAGYSIVQGLDSVSVQVDEPMASELKQALTEARLGRPVEDALEEMSLRLQSKDFAWAVLAIKIQREVGGNLAELLDGVTDTMVQRERLRREIAGLTAEGKISAIILGILPPGVGVAMWFLNPSYIGLLFSSALGLGIVSAATIMAIAGFVWMKKMLDLEI